MVHLQVLYTDEGEKMKRQIKIIGAIFFCVLILALWSISYYSLNKRYQDNLILKIVKYDMGKFIPFENDIVNGFNIDGYEIKINSAEILNCKGYLSKYEVTETIPSLPEKICLLTATLKNNESQAEGVFLPDFILKGVDSYTDCNIALTMRANPVLKETPGISLAPQSEYDIVIIYNLRESDYSYRTWENIEDYPMTLQITDYPTTKEIQLEFQ